MRDPTAGPRGRSPWFVAAAAAAAFATSGPTGAQALATFDVWRGLQLELAPGHENLATKNQAFNVWAEGAQNAETHEVVVALIHRYNDLDRRGDDEQYAVAWESNGTAMKEVQRIPMSCPDVELVVPNRGPHVFEARLDVTAYSLHPECGCHEASNRPCPNGVQANSTEKGVWQLQSVTDSHFVSLLNDYGELIADRAVLGRLDRDVIAEVASVGGKPVNATGAAPDDFGMGCPGSYDEPLGKATVTADLIREHFIQAAADVDGKWCLVKRGGCTSTAKVKLCEVSGAVGTIIVDHGLAEGDQEIEVFYDRSALERARRPVVFVSEEDGEELLRQMQKPGNVVQVSIGPSIGGAAPAGYTPGSGIIVHAMGKGTAAQASKAYPDIFPSNTASWVEVSDVRDIMFACFAWLNEIRLYDISDPMVDMPWIGTLPSRCSRSGYHDYRVLDYLDKQGRYTTLLVDPANSYNQLYYWDTHDVNSIVSIRQIHANWESPVDGLGQVRPGGASGRFHFVTWHCSDLFCGKQHGDAVYALDTEDLEDVPVKIPIPQLSAGGFARDVACGGIDQSLCVVSLTWDGLVAIDAGLPNTANMLRVIAESSGHQPFNDDRIPLSTNYLKMHSGAQKVYASRKWPGRFYVEHANFSMRPLRMGDAIRALQLNEVYMAEVVGYDPTVPMAGSWSGVRGDDGDGRRRRNGPGRGQPGGDDKRERGSNVGLIVLSTLLGVTCCCLVPALGMALYVRRRPAQQTPGGGRSGAGSGNVVVGRPVEEAAAGTDGAAIAGQVTPVQDFDAPDNPKGSK